MDIAFTIYQALFYVLYKNEQLYSGRIYMKKIIFQEIVITENDLRKNII